MNNFDTITANVSIFDIELYNNKDVQTIDSKHYRHSAGWNGKNAV